MTTLPASRLAHIVNGLLRRVVKPRAHLWSDARETRALFDGALFTRAWVAGPVRFAPSTDAPVRGEWTTPRIGSDGMRTILHLHGGGYQSGSPGTVRPITGGLAIAARARVFAPDYRRAPEHRFPAAFDDTLASYRWLLSQGIPSTSIAVSGDSAGGGLALALLLALRDGGEPMPACATLISPWTDMLGTGESNRTNMDRCALFNEQSIALASRAYLGDADPRDVHASPVYGRFHGLPPVLVHVGEDEMLRDDSTRVVDQIRAARGDAHCALWPVVPHAWQLYGTLMREARESLRALGQFIAAKTSVPVAPGIEQTR